MTGSIGEISAAKYLMQLGYEVFLPIDGHASCDLVAVKESVLRISVKSTAYQVRGKYRVDLRQNRYKRKTKFNALDSDRLIVYIIPEDRCLVLVSEQYHGKSTATIV